MIPSSYASIGGETPSHSSLSKLNRSDAIALTNRFRKLVKVSRSKPIPIKRDTASLSSLISNKEDLLVELQARSQYKNKFALKTRLQTQKRLRMERRLSRDKRGNFPLRYFHDSVETKEESVIESDAPTPIRREQVSSNGSSPRTLDRLSPIRTSSINEPISPEVRKVQIF